MLSSISRLKSDYKYDDKYTNAGILYSPVINVPKPVSRTVEVIVSTEMSREPIAFTIDGMTVWHLWLYVP